jgi:hypothetical protein
MENGSLDIMEDGFHCTIEFSRTMTCELDSRFREPNWTLLFDYMKLLEA